MRLFPGRSIKFCFLGHSIIYILPDIRQVLQGTLSLYPRAQILTIDPFTAPLTFGGQLTWN